MTLVSRKQAKRYSRALFDLCTTTEIDNVLDQLIAVSNLVAKNHELIDVSQNPVYSIFQRIQGVSAVVAKGSNISDQRVLNLIKVLIENNSLMILEEVKNQFESAVLAVKKSLAVTVSTAFILSDNEVEEIKISIQNASGGLAKLTTAVDKSLIGGMILQIGDKILDKSVRGSLERIEVELRQ